MFNMSNDYPNIRAEVNRKVGYTENESIVLNKDYFDCINIKGSTDNSGCSAENSLCNCPCTGGNSGEASAVPLFREPTDEEMAFAKKEITVCSDDDEYAGYFILDPDALESSCGVQCHGKHYYSTFQAQRTYSTFWSTGKKTPLYRNALINLYTAQQAVCIIPGNLNVRLGEFINIPTDNSPLGEKYSGCWLISNIRHAIPSLQNYKMILTLIRDSKIESPE
jgi:hypothetical protein